MTLGVPLGVGLDEEDLVDVCVGEAVDEPVWDCVPVGEGLVDTLAVCVTDAVAPAEALCESVPLVVWLCVSVPLWLGLGAGVAELVAVAV